MCSNYRGLTLLSFPGPSQGALERGIRRIVDPQFKKQQSGFCPGCGTVDWLYTIRRVLEGAWEFIQSTVELVPG